MNAPTLYTKINGPPRRVVQDLADEFSSEIAGMLGRSIDIGSGPGDVVSDFILPKMDAKATVVCSDISEHMVNYAKEQYKGNGRMSFLQLDIQTPNLPDDMVEYFDHVMSFYCLHWCQDMRQVFENMFSLLRPGGTSFVTFVCKSPFLSAYKKLAAMPRYAPYMKDADNYIPVYQHVEKPRDSLRALLEQVGFNIEHCSLREKSWIFNTRKDYLDFLVPLNPFIGRIPADLKEQYTKDLVREAASKNIVFNKSNENENEFGVVLIHHVFVLYLTKPSDD